LLLEVLTSANKLGKLLASDGNLLREHGDAIIIGRHREARLVVAMLDTHTLHVGIIHCCALLGLKLILE